MGKSFLAMKTDPAASVAARKLANHTLVLGGGLGFIGTFLQWLAFAAAVYLLVLDKTNWKTNMLTGLLVPYIFFTMPGLLFNFIRGEIGSWIAFVVVILRLFFPRHFPDWLELPGSLILLTVVAPSIFADTFRGSWLIIGVGVCLVIGCYLLHEHIKASGGLKQAFRKANGVSNTIGILLLFIYPVWAVVMWFL